MFYLFTPLEILCVPDSPAPKELLQFGLGLYFGNSKFWAI
jgi:hypothetical protein